MKKTIIGALVCAAALTANAQSGTNSPYSQFGLGVLSDRSQGFNRGMNGLGLGLRFSNQVNTLNPASYSAVDSLTMIFDAGLSGQVTNFKEVYADGTSKKINANNSDFEYVVGSFRLMPKLGFSFGILPFTNIGYNYSGVSVVGTDSEGQPTSKSTETHSGSGGIHEAFVGAGWNFYKGLSVGANIGYLWGSYDKSVTVENTDGYVNSVMRTYSAIVRSYNMDFGVQWEHRWSKNDVTVVGLTYGLGHSLNSDPELVTVISNPQTGVASYDTIRVADGLHMPSSLGLGVSWTHKNSLTVGLDYTLQKWGNCDIPELNAVTGEYDKVGGLLKDRHKLTLGTQWVPNPMSRKFLKRVNYRFGVSYNTPYVKVNGKDGPKEYSVSAGFGIPIVNAWNNRSMLNISAQWVRASAKDLVTENTFRINIGLTFNERWFMKWKVE